MEGVDFVAYTQSNTSKKGLFYLKDKKAMIYQATTTRIDGLPSTTYRPVAPAPLWCYTRQLTAEQVFGAAQYYQNETRIFVFNYRDGVTASGAYVRYAGTWYEVTRVDVPEDYKGGEMFVYVKDCRTNIKESNVLPYSAE